MSDEPTVAVSPLRQRMIEDMTMRKLSEKTQTQYIRAVKRLARFLRRPLDTVNGDDLRRFQLHLVQLGLSPISINSTIVGVRFFLENTLDRPELVRKVRPVRVERRLPVILSREEVARLIGSAPSLKYRTALSVAYGAGLRAGEVCALKTTDIDSDRMTLRVEQGKGHKDRYAVLPPLLLDRLREWWRFARPMGMVRDGAWLFPGHNPINPIGPRMLNRAIHAAAVAAGIDKRVSMHTLRHCFATHLLEQKEDIRVIQVLLGHKKLTTTALYTQVAAEVLQQVVSPIEDQRPTT
jgi:integrase/recombinase XerD